jgi:hypothetical protein
MSTLNFKQLQFVAEVQFIPFTFSNGHQGASFMQL